MYFTECADVKKIQYLNSLNLSDFGFDKPYQKEIKSYLNQMLKSNGTHTFKYTQKNNSRYYAPNSIQNMSKVIRGFLYNNISTDVDQSNSSPTILRMLCRKYNIQHVLLNDYCSNRESYIEKDNGIKLKIIKMIYSNRKSKQNKQFENLENELKSIQKQLIQIEEMKQIYIDHIESTEPNYEGKALNCICFYYENQILQEMKKFISFNNLEIFGLMFDGFLIKGNHYDNQTLLKDCESFVNTRFAGLDMKLTFKEHDTSIQMPKDFEPVNIDNLYEKQKEELEKHVSKIEMPPLYLHKKNEKITMLKYSELKEYCKSKFKKVRDDEGKLRPFVDIWSQDENIQSYESIIFDPKILDQKNDFNLYDGFDCKNVEDYDDDNIFFKLVRHVINDDKLYEYFLDWLAHIIQKPYQKTNNAIVFYSEVKGVGKDSIVCALKKLFSKYYAQLESIEDIEKNFNAHLCNKLLVYGEEITSKAKNFNDKLKSIITRTTCNMEKKGFDSIQLNDYSNFIFSTNNENCFKVESGDRRLCLINCIEQRLIDSDIDCEEYYKYIEQPENIDNIYSVLKNRTIKYKIGVDPPPMTAYKQELLFENKPAYIQFLFKCDAFEFVGNEMTINELHEKCTKYAKDNYLSTSFTFQKFCKSIKAIIEPFYKRKSSKRFYDFNDINKFNKSLYDFDKEYYLYVNNLDCFKLEVDDTKLQKTDLDYGV